MSTIRRLEPETDGHAADRPSVATAETIAVQQHLLPQTQQDQLRRIIVARLGGRVRAAGGKLDGEAVKGVNTETTASPRAIVPTPPLTIVIVATPWRTFTKPSRSTLSSKPASRPGDGRRRCRIGDSPALRASGNSTAGQGPEGIFTRSRLQIAVKSGDQTVGKRAMSEGDALYQDLAQAGKTVLPNKVPDSGTPERIETLVAAETLLRRARPSCRRDRDAGTDYRWQNRAYRPGRKTSFAR